MKRAPAEEPTPLPSARSNTPQGGTYPPRHCLRGFAPPKSAGHPREEYRILADPAMVEGIREGLNDVTAGRVVSLEETFAVVLPTALAEFP